jgi:3'-5' exoribonuclease
MQVKDIVKEGTVSGIFLILDSQHRIAKNGNAFAALRIGDRSGEIPFKVWRIKEKTYDELQKGQIIKVQAMAKNFNGTLQLEADGEEEFYQICQEGDYEASDFLPVTMANIDEMWGIIDNTRQEVMTEAYQVLLDTFFGDEKFRQKFSSAPAAMRHHHAYLGGLLEHTAGVVVLCQAAANQYTEVNRDLLLTGALLHDIGKIQSYKGKLGFEGTDQGKLIGHLVLGVQMVMEAIYKLRDLRGSDFFPLTMELPLVHLMLSHHGRLEWGSPMEPVLLEACLLHHADHMDAEAAKFREAIRNHPEDGGDWTAYNPTLKRSIYLPDLEFTDNERRTTENEFIQTSLFENIYNEDVGKNA